ncbi:acetoin utilization protein AcuC [candidate division KSB3 bacterium]|uniref:Acetoin utilization protein AcuC n=1 Tax=candidate division KSB3 bacterium TaxID=2044937 RepID=A0A2G6KM29_9BACT|nr:MAG: acetoin utilization protein AcuC [candidate division KSB3 bacterium]
MKIGFLYSDEFEKMAYSPSHPLKPMRFRLTYELAKAYGLFRSFHHRLIKAKPCTIGDLVAVHSVEYIEAVEHANIDLPEWDMQAYGLNTLDNPLFPQVYKWSLLAVGASVQAAKLVETGEVDTAFNMAGGLHHASRNRASGFCYFNDIAIIIQRLLNKGYRVAYVDIDAHHGDGVQEMFYRTDRVLTVSIHENGFSAFPGTGFEREIGEEEGQGYAVNIPIPSGSDDEVFCYAFNEIVPELFEKFQPDVMVTLLGTDTFRSDPLTSLEVTTSGFCRVVEALKALSPGKWIALGGGGYDVLTVPRAWTLAMAIMCGVELPYALPKHYQKFLRRKNLIDEEKQHEHYRLRDLPYQTDLATKITHLIELEKTLSYIRNRQLTMIDKRKSLSQDS